MLGYMNINSFVTLCQLFQEIQWYYCVEIKKEIFFCNCFRASFRLEWFFSYKSFSKSLSLIVFASCFLLHVDDSKLLPDFLEQVFGCSRFFIFSFRVESGLLFFISGDSFYSTNAFRTIILFGDDDDALFCFRSPGSFNYIGQQNYIFNKIVFQCINGVVGAATLKFRKSHAKRKLFLASSATI